MSTKRKEKCALCDHVFKKDDFQYDFMEYTGETGKRYFCDTCNWGRAEKIETLIKKEEKELWG